MDSHRTAAFLLLLASATTGVAAAQDYPHAAGSHRDRVTGTPEELMAKLKSDDAKVRKLFRHIGLSPDK